MSRELIIHYPKIHEYSMIWMDTITHVTRKGTSEFGLTNTNKLIRQYAYATGLKTGSTSNAGFCVSATAEKDGVELIAVIMGADNSKDRFQDAVKLLDYGFGKCTFYVDDAVKNVAEVPVTGGYTGRSVRTYGWGVPLRGYHRSRSESDTPEGGSQERTSGAGGKR